MPLRPAEAGECDTDRLDHHDVREEDDVCLAVVHHRLDAFDCLLTRR